MLKEKVNFLKEVLKKANYDADTELTELNQAIEGLKVEHKQSLIKPTDAPSETDNLEAFQRACEEAVWDSLEKINKEAYLRPKAEAAKVHEHTSDFWQWLVKLANFFSLGSSKAPTPTPTPTPTSQVSQNAGADVSIQFKEKFAQTITKEREGEKKQDEPEDKEDKENKENKELRNQ